MSNPTANIVDLTLNVSCSVMRGTNHLTDGVYGPFPFNGKLYTITGIVPAPAGLPFTVAVSAYASTDNGVTWIKKDAANQPTNLTANVISTTGYFASFYPKSGGSVVYIAYLYEDEGPGNPDGSSHVGLWSFDMSTETWTQIALNGPLCYSAQATFLYLVRDSSGTFTLMYQVGGTFGPNIVSVMSVTYSGGWGVPILLGSQPVANGPGQMADGRYGALIGITDADVPILVWMSQIDSSVYCNGSIVLAWPTSLPYGTTANGAPGSTFPWMPIRPTPANWNSHGRFLSTLNKMVWALPLYHSVASFFVLDVALLIADCSVNPPTFTVQIVESNISCPNSFQFATEFVCDAVESTFAVVWGNSAGGGTVRYATATALTGPYGAPQTYWSNFGSINRAPVMLSIQKFPLDPGILIGANISIPTGIADLTYYLTGAAPVIVTCPIGSATLNLPYTGTIVASGGTGPYTFAITIGALPPGLTLDPATGIITGIPLLSGTFSFTVQATDSLGATATANCSIVIPPVPSTGGRGFIHIILNHFDSCLGREYLLYKLINRELLKCGVKPFCFRIDERDWGGNFSEHEEVPMGPPEGAIAFNPTGAIPLPTVASGDNVIFQSRVPIGYDGVILGQYHGYITDPTAFPVPIFVEGSGDIVWRLECAGRFMRDCGLMEVSIGTLQNMSPIAGGLQVRSGELIRYIVAAPNVTGALTAGVGNIVAGLHGWFWPRH